jgi:hypothetical protein
MICYIHVLIAIATIIRSVNFEKQDRAIPKKDAATWS